MSQAPIGPDVLRNMHFKRTGNLIAVPDRSTLPPTTSRIDLTDDADDDPILLNPTNSSSRYSSLSRNSSTCQVSNSSLNPSSSRSSGRPITRKGSHLANSQPTSALQNKPKPNQRVKCQNLPLKEILSSNPSPVPGQSTRKFPSSSTRSNSRLSDSTKSPQSVSATRSQSSLSSKSNTRTLSISTTPSTDPRLSCSPIPPSPEPAALGMNLPKAPRSDSSSVITSCASSSNSQLDPPASSGSSPFDSTSILSASKKTTVQPSRDLWSQMQESLSEKGISLQSNRIHRQPKYTHEAWDQVVPDDFSLEITQVIDNPESLCPFCDEVLPQKPSAKLVELLNYLKSKPQVVRRLESKNPLALRLPFSETGTYCQLHRAEKMLIPKGIRNGWPSTIDFPSLPSRIRRHRRYLHRVCTREIASNFLEMALQDWAAQGPTKARSLLSELATYEDEQTGYYGTRGYEVIYRTLHAMFLGPSRIDSITKLARPLSPDFLIRKVLVPEAALCLIAEDLKLERDDPLVQKTLEDSRSYGVIMFPDQDDGVGSPDGKSRLEDEQEETAPLSPEPQELKRKRKSESCEIEVLKPNEKSPSKDVKVNTTGPLRPPKKHTKTKNSPSSTSSPHRNQPLKRPTGERPCKIYPKKRLENGWKASIY